MWRRSRRGYNTQKWHDAALEDGDNMINLNAKNRSSTRGGNLTWKVIQNISDPCTSHHTALSTTTGTKKKYIYINIIYIYIYVYIEEEMLFIGIQMEDQVWSPVHIYNVHIWIYILHVYTYINIYIHKHTRTLSDVEISCALCTMSIIDPCHTLRNPTNIVGEIGLSRFQSECWAIPILCMPVHEHHHGYWMRQMNISNTISKDCNPICQIVPLHWHYIDMNIYSYTHLVVIAIGSNGVPKAMWSYENDVTIRFIFGNLGWPQMYICTNINRIM